MRGRRRLREATPLWGGRAPASTSPPGSRPPPSPSPMPTLTASGLNILLMEMRCTLPSRVTTSMWMMNTLTGEALTCVKGGREKRTGGRLRGE